MNKIIIISLLVFLGLIYKYSTEWSLRVDDFKQSTFSCDKRQKQCYLINKENTIEAIYKFDEIKNIQCEHSYKQSESGLFSGYSINKHVSVNYSGHNRATSNNYIYRYFLMRDNNKKIFLGSRSFEDCNRINNFIKSTNAEEKLEPIKLGITKIGAKMEFKL